MPTCFLLGQCAHKGSALMACSTLATSISAKVSAYVLLKSPMLSAKDSYLDLASFVVHFAVVVSVPMYCNKPLDGVLCAESPTEATSNASDEVVWQHFKGSVFSTNDCYFFFMAFIYGFRVVVFVTMRSNKLCDHLWRVERSGAPRTSASHDRMFLRQLQKDTVHTTDDLYFRSQVHILHQFISISIPVRFYESRDNLLCVKSLAPTTDRTSVSQ